MRIEKNDMLQKSNHIAFAEASIPRQGHTLLDLMKVQILLKSGSYQHRFNIDTTTLAYDPA